MKASSKKPTNNKPKIKVLVIVGPTASGKSALAVRLARKFKGEVISADSRQVYTGLDIGSGKITPAEMKGVSHHLLDVATPKKTFTVAEYQKLGQAAIADVSARGKLPIICGGSPFYIYALIDGTVFPEVPPNKKLRSVLEKKTTTALCKILEKKDPRRFAGIDKDNRHRLVRAIEIATALGKVPEIKSEPSQYRPLFIGIKPTDEELKSKIKRRLLKRIDEGMIAEVKKLHKNDVSWKRLEKFGLEYRKIARFLQNKITRDEMIAELETNIWQFSKRQMTWFKKDKRIKWFSLCSFSTIKNGTREFLK
jgi:tRNA dimethylallyltransferase